MTLNNAAFMRLAPPDAAETAIPVWPVLQPDLERWLGAAEPDVAKWLRAQGFDASAGAVCATPSADGGVGGVALGLGAGDGSAMTGQLFGAVPFAAPEGQYRIDASGLSSGPPQGAALGWLLGSYAYTRYKPARRAPGRLIPPEGVDAARAERLARGVALARDLVNTPAEEMGPKALEQEARAVAKAHGAETAVTVGDALLAENYPLIHAVGRAAAQAPRLIDLRWGPEDAPKITLVGKGVCFDTGGLDIKPSSGMILMKKDMGGAAAALALASMIMGAKLHVRLRVLIPAVENSISANSFRPGDVLPSRKGLWVENRNTDAEGRLVLADALAEADSESPDLIFNFATLTGAARVALGPDLPPFYTDDDGLAQEIAAAGLAMADPVWRMPFWPGYEADIGSSIADVTNAPATGMAGSITAALFLRRFVSSASTLAHFDIFAWQPKARPGRPMGGACQAALAVYKVIEDRCG